jgi:hypothetical protein
MVVGTVARRLCVDCGSNLLLVCGYIMVVVKIDSCDYVLTFK